MSGTGKVTAVKAGFCTVRATTDNSRSAYVYFRVIVPEYINLDTGDITLGVGESFTSKATVSPEGVRTTLTWKSGRKSVAKVDKRTGKITARKKGEAVIKVTADNGISEKITVTVRPAPKRVALYRKGVRLKKDQVLTLRKGRKLQLEAFTNGSSASHRLTWKSSNKSVATVSKTGKVTARKKGTAVITVTTYNKKTFSIRIRVK